MAALVVNHGDLTRIAREVGRDSSVVGRWVSGARKPDGESRGLLWRKFQIPPHWFDEPVDAAAVSPPTPGAAA